MINDIAILRPLLKQFEFKKLFNQLGWNKFDQTLPIEVGGHLYHLQGVAQQRGVQIFVCSPDAAGKIPAHELRRKIDTELSKLAQEHLLIFADAKKTTQVWQWLSREAGRTTALRQQTYYASASGDALLQKLDHIAFPLSAEESLTLTGVVRQLKDAFDREKVTKTFYDRFKVEHDAFLKFIAHIPDAEFQRWYASVMINRLMFLYFIQGKGFLDGKTDYLKSKLDASHGHYYRDFLCPLFFDGLAKREAERTPAIRTLLGRVPYLNGGLFAKHQIEERYGEKITIPDEAFERLYQFFQEFDWTLDERPIRSGKEINPDVLGYIFEKYINQKQMGAYYTKEDITEYIGKNTILPFLFDQARRDCRVAFEGEHTVWELPAADPDAYIYPAVRHGADLPLPENIARGVGSVAGRGDWNQPAPPPYGLPTEIWRETVARRERCTAVREKLSSGAVRDINDFVTLNLNIRQFALDALTTWEGADLIDTLKEVAKHPNRDYFVFKSIIVNNLYGVDIMEEATEICKLRLFLKLAAQVEPDPTKDNFGIEPLPDIDFNIRAGNTLVGYATEEQVLFAITGHKQKAMDFDGKWEVFEQRLRSVERKFRAFQDLQTQLELPSGSLTNAKDDLQTELGSLRNELDDHMAIKQYAKLNSANQKAWRDTTQPFHWFVEFYKVIKAGGFNIIIGNPPYVASHKMKALYTLRGYETSNASDIYANVMERSAMLLNSTGRTGMIVPLSLTFSGDFASLRAMLRRDYQANWFSSFAHIPAALFSADVRVRNTIHIASKCAASMISETTVLHRWFSQARPHIFANLSYIAFAPQLYETLVPKINTHRIAVAFERRRVQSKITLEYVMQKTASSSALHFKQSAYNWLNFCRVMPPCYSAAGQLIPHTKFGQVYFADDDTRDIAFLFLNGKIMFCYWCMIGDDFDVTRWMFAGFPFDLREITETDKQRLLCLSDDLESLMQQNTTFKLNAGKRVGNYNLARCRTVTDQSDAVFAKYLGLEPVWDDIELLYTQMVKTSFNQEETD